MRNQKVITVLIVILSVILLSGTIFLYKRVTPEKVDTADTNEKTESEYNEEDEVKPLYLDLSSLSDNRKEIYLSSSSLKNDLTVFFTDNLDKKIEDNNFFIKLLFKEDSDALKLCSNEIKKDNKIIKALKKSSAKDLPANKDILEEAKKITEKNDDAYSLEESFESLFKDNKNKVVNDALVFDLTEERPATLYELFLYKREKDILSYNEVLLNANGITSSDEDMDGLIYFDDILPGEYALCFIPDKKNEYIPSSFLTFQRVYEDLSYTAIENIELKTVVYSEDDDIASHNIPVEATLLDTTPFIESEKIENENDGSITYLGWQTINGDRYYFDKDGNPVSGDQVILGIRYRFASDGKQMTGGFGIDVSKWQGKINWEIVSRSIDFTIIRCAYRGSRGKMAVDPRFFENIKGAKDNNIRTGVYFYSRALNEAEAVEEASLTIKLLNEAGGCDLPVYIDMEDEAQRRLTTEERNRIVHAYCETIRAAGYKPGLYASYSWLLHELTMEEFSDISIWCARYNTFCGLPCPYDCWQYSSRGTIPGIDDYFVDMNEGF